MVTLVYVCGVVGTWQEALARKPPDSAPDRRQFSWPIQRRQGKGHRQGLVKTKKKLRAMDAEHRIAKRRMGDKSGAGWSQPRWLQHFGVCLTLLHSDNEYLYSCRQDFHLFSPIMSEKSNSPPYRQPAEGDQQRSTISISVENSGRRGDDEKKKRGQSTKRTGCPVFQKLNDVHRYAPKQDLNYPEILTRGPHVELPTGIRARSCAPPAG